MDAVEFINERSRMCNYTFKKNRNCSKCKLYKNNTHKDLSCEDYINSYPDQAVEIVEEFSKSHPRKTILDDLIEKHPNIKIYTNGSVKWPDCCAMSLGYVETCQYKVIDENTHKLLGTECAKCWSKILDKETK